MKYQPPTGSTDPNAPYVGANLAAGLQGSKVPPKAIEQTMREIVAVITAAGLTPSDTDLGQLLKAIPKIIPSASLVHEGVDTGTTNAIVVDVSPSITAYQRGAVYNIRVLNTITGAATANLDGLGVRNIIRADGTPARTGDLVAGMEAVLVDDGTSLQIAGLLTANLPSSAVWARVASDTFVVPPGVTKLKRISVWGGGAGGSGSATSSNSAAGGYGGGYAVRFGVSVTPGQVISVVVGGAGTGGDHATSGPGGTGGTTSFGSLLSATGGSSSSGGSGVGGDINQVGGSPQTQYALAGVPISGSGGGGANGAGNSQFTVGTGSYPGTSPGGGGSGGAGVTDGGPGATGRVEVEY